MPIKTIYDTTHVMVVDTIHRVIADSVTLEALKNSQVFYNDAYGHLLAIAGLLLTFILVVAIFQFVYDKYSADKVLAQANQKAESLIKEQALRIQDVLDARYKQVNVSIMHGYLFQGRAHEESKHPTEAFWQYYLALSVARNLPEDSFELGAKAMEGIGKHWNCVYYSGKHPAIEALRSYEVFCTEHKLMELWKKANALRLEIEDSEPITVVTPMDFTKILKQKE